MAQLCRLGPFIQSIIHVYLSISHRVLLKLLEKVQGNRAATLCSDERLQAVLKGRYVPAHRLKLSLELEATDVQIYAKIRSASVASI